MTRYFDASGAYQSLIDVQLGDVITLGAGPSMAVRAVERRLAAAVGTMTGFVLAGEVGPQSALLSVPANPHEPVGVYTPLDHIPAHARSAVPVCEGVVSYWAPHLPNLSGAQGELGYKVAKVRGSVDPMVLLWRGAERVVFLRTSSFPIGDLLFTCLPRDASATEVDQVRYAATVGYGASAPYGAPEELPAVRPLTRALRRIR